VIEARSRKFSSQNLAEAGREHAGPFCGITGVCIRLFMPHTQFLFKYLRIGSCIIDDVLTE
jgi:hypothetical protein